MLNRFLLFVMVTCIVSGQLVAQQAPGQTVAAAVEVLRKAMVDADQAALEKMAADSLSYGHSGGKVENKKEFIENIVSGNSDFLMIELTDQTIYESGKTAIVRHKLMATTNDKGKGPGTVKLAILTVWVKHKKEWQMLARQAVKLP